MSKGILSTAKIKGKTYFNSFANDEFPVVEQVSDTKQIGHGDGYVSDGIIPETSEIDELKLMGNTVQNLVPSEPTPTEVFTQYEEAAFVQSSSDTNIKMGSGELKQAIVEGNTYKNLANKLSNPTEVISVEKLVQPIYPNTFTDEYQHILDDAEFASAELEGKTLVNLLADEYSYVNLSTNAEVELNSSVNTYNEPNVRVKTIMLNKNLQANKKYILFLDVVSLENGVSIGGVTAAPSEEDYCVPRFTNTGLQCKIFETKLEATKISVYLDFNETNPTIAKIKQPVLLEYQEGMENWDIPYFEGMKSVETIKVTTYNSPVQFGKGGRL